MITFGQLPIGSFFRIGHFADAERAVKVNGEKAIVLFTLLGLTHTSTLDPNEEVFHVSGPITFEEARLLTWNKRGWTKIANNTWIRKSESEPDSVAVFLYNTEIITLRPDGSYKVRTGGHNTKLTCERIARLSPLSDARMRGGRIMTGLNPDTAIDDDGPLTEYR